MRLTHLVRCAGCASKLSPTLLGEILGSLPRSENPDVLVGFDTRDDAGVYRLAPDLALVQTLDFFTPIVDEPRAYGRIAAANALSDVYAMGGRPLTVLNIACVSPSVAPTEVWAEVFHGAYEKATEAGAEVIGGHTVDDDQPKFGLSVTGLVNPDRMLANDRAEPGHDVYLSKPLGTGIATTAAKLDLAQADEIAAAIASMERLNRDAAEAALEVGVRCATDITGFGLAGHLFNVARASGVTIRIDWSALPLLPGVQRLIELGATTGGGERNAAFVGRALTFGASVPEWARHVVVDPQTSGGLATFSSEPVAGAVRIGSVAAGPAAIDVA